VLRFSKQIKKGKDKIKYGGDGGVTSNFPVLCDFCLYSGVRGGGKCPEEEHTTCSGGPTINCHKRGLRGERNYFIS
jgi:hypothetical protein